MSIYSISNNSFYPPSFSAKAGADTNKNTENNSGLVQLSDHAKNLLSNHAATENTSKEDKEEAGKESVQISSSIGRLSRVTGLQRDEVAALYRSIDKLT